MNDRVRERIVLAFAGTAADAAELARLVEGGAEVVTVTVDVGQARDVDEVRAQALSLGAVRAHVFDLREEFARDYVLPALRSNTLEALAGGVPAAPLVAGKLGEVTAIEQASRASGAETFDAAADPQRPRHRTARTLLERPAADPAQTPDTPAHVDLQFAGGLPVAINGVPLTAAELLESVALIAGQHGIGRLPHLEAPAVPVLHAAYAALEGNDGIVPLEFLKGRLSLRAAHDRTPSLVNHA